MVGACPEALFHHRPSRQDPEPARIERMPTRQSLPAASRIPELAARVPGDGWFRHTSAMQRLTARDLRRSRGHIVVIQAGWDAFLVALVFVDMDLDPVDWARPALWSAPYVANGLVLAALAGAATVWLVPRATLATAVVLGAVSGLLDPAWGLMWWPLAMTAGLGLGFLVVRDARSRPRGDTVVPSTGVAFRDSWAAPPSRDRWLGWGGVALAGAAALACLVAHQMMVADVAAFEARATRVVAQVTSTEGPDDEIWLTVVVDGVEYEFEDPYYGDTLVGTPVEVLIDDDGRAVLAGAGQDDPSWLLGVAAAIPLFGLAAWNRFLARGRRRERLVSNGAPGVTVRVVCNGELALVLPVDADWPALELVNLDGHVNRDVVTREIASQLADEEWGDAPEFEDAEEPLPSSAMEVAAWADGLRAEVEAAEARADEPETMTSHEKAIAEAAVGPDTNGAEPFILVGGWVSGSSVALARATGQVWLAEIQEAKPFKGRRRFLREARPDTGCREDRPAAESEWRSLLFEWAIRNVSWTRWVAAGAVALVGALFIPWVLPTEPGDGFGIIQSVIFAVGAVCAPFWATSWAWGEFARFRQGFGAYGLVLDEVIARDRVELIAPGGDAVGVRLRDPEGVIGLDPEVLREGASAGEAAAELRAWIDDAPAGARSGRRPSPALVATLVMLVSWAVQLLL